MSEENMFYVLIAIAFVSGLLIGLLWAMNQWHFNRWKKGYDKGYEQGRARGRDEGAAEAFDRARTRITRIRSEAEKWQAFYLGQYGPSAQQAARFDQGDDGSSVCATGFPYSPEALSPSSGLHHDAGDDPSEHPDSAWGKTVPLPGSHD